ncbi:Diaminopimelate epimerase-like protein [Microthyrium microscopicum]|uniref:trans-L-3-hydroxyproline dehydratase n=1 Tax=Microthyrium microscopicum TaxID=703497 RepID=A0A6A6U6P3_9PEZI|nr:Diaminopimelate epimerase-like protein [Microthyrium microscopicum]
MANVSILSDFVSVHGQPINTVEMHTTGEPTRIIYSGFPQPQGHTLLQKMTDAKLRYDNLRRRLMLEPRGHSIMYGALLIHGTEFTSTGEADVGVLFMHNEGWSTMCGHATIALGRFLVDFDTNACPELFPRRDLKLDTGTMTTTINLHCPCGVVNITVPVTIDTNEKLKSDPERDVSFVSVESYALGIATEISLTPAYRWPELGNRTAVTADFCYGGAFYCVIEARELGFAEGLKSSNIDVYQRAAACLEAAIVANPQYKRLYQHPASQELSFLYGVIITDEQQGEAAKETAGGDTCLCFFAGGQIDRSPTGSGVAARRALAHAKGILPPDNKWTYHSLVSVAHDGVGAFIAKLACNNNDRTARGADDSVKIQIEGSAFYTGFATFLAEPTDIISNAGFEL